MLDQFFEWLEQRSHRWPTANVLLVSLNLVLVDSPDFSAIIGAITISLLGLHWLHSVCAGAVRGSGPIHPFDLLLLWLPGAFAIGLSAGGLWLSARGFPLVGLPVFASHAVLLVRIVADQEHERSIRIARAEIR